MKNSNQEKRKAQLMRYVWTYKQRRVKMTLKIKAWEQAIRRLNSRIPKKQCPKIEHLIKQVNEYFGDDIKKRGISLARNIFYKYGIEAGLSSMKLGLAIGRSRTAARVCRSKFIRSFPKHPENQIAYHKFKDYIGDINQIDIPTKLKKAS